MKLKEKGSFQLSVIIGCVFACVIAGMAYMIQILSDKNDALNKEIGEMRSAISTLNTANDKLMKEIALNEILKENTHEISTKHIEETKTIEKKAKVYKKALPKRVVKDTVATELQNKNSESRMRVLWDSYCAGSSNDPLCLGEKQLPKLPIIPSEIDVTDTKSVKDVKPSKSLGTDLNTLLIEKEV